MTSQTTEPFARGQAKAFQTGPWLGGYLYVLPAAVAANGSVAIPHGLRVPPRVAVVLSAPSGTFTSPVAQGAPWNASTATVVFQNAQPTGTVVFLY